MKTPIYKKWWFWSAIIIFIAIIGVLVWYFQFKKPYNLAVKNYNQAVEMVEIKNTDLDSAINRVEALLNSGEPAFDEVVVENAESTVSDAKNAKRQIGDMPNNTEEIVARTSELNEPLDYTAEIRNLNDAEKTLSDSIELMKQLTNPSEEFVISRLQTIMDASAIQAVTEDHDPNGNLNKAGGYTAAIYFSSPLVDISTVYGADIVERGVDGGGCVEVYANVEDAEKRNTYLSGFDGAGILSPGSHSVLGTMVIRTSDKLTASQQKELEAEIIDVLIKQ